ncbi:MAG: hypothetical protein AAGK78_04125 [Planctomycetota bacterium]
MRLLPHIVLAYIAVGLHAGLGALLAVGEMRVLLPWIAAAFIASTVPAASAPLGALLVGLALDLVGGGAIGTYAAAFGVGGWVIAKLRAGRNTSRPMRLWSYMAAGAFVVAYAAQLLLYVREIASGSVGDAGIVGLFFTRFFNAMGTGFFTAVIALPFAYLLWKLHSRFRLRDASY